MENLHVTPVNDLREHEDTWTCWCRPVEHFVAEGELEDVTAIIWVHNAADNREHFERDHRPCKGCGLARVN